MKMKIMLTHGEYAEVLKQGKLHKKEKIDGTFLCDEDYFEHFSSHTKIEKVTTFLETQLAKIDRKPEESDTYFTLYPLTEEVHVNRETIILEVDTKNVLYYDNFLYGEAMAEGMISNNKDLFLERLEKEGFSVEDIFDEELKNPFLQRMQKKCYASWRRMLISNPQDTVGIRGIIWELNESDIITPIRQIA